MENTRVNNFIIAEHRIRIVFKKQQSNSIHLLPSFKPFEKQDDHRELFFELIVDDDLTVVSKDHRERIRTFDTGNGDVIVDLLDNGGYQYIIKDTNGGECCMLQTNKEFSVCACALNGDYNMRCFGLNNALMLIFAFAGSFHDTLLIHASLIRNCDRGYAFIAKSGTGKSTQTSMWLRYIRGCELMNDDNPIIRIINEKTYIYGSPWSGKTPCYRNVKAPLGAITRIDRSKKNSAERLTPTEAFASVLPACSSMMWDKDIYHRICDTIVKIVETTNIYVLHCLPNKASAELCYKIIAQQ